MHKKMNKNRANLLLSCQEKPGIISTVSNFLLEHKANIVQFDQHTTDPQSGTIFIRVAFDLEDFASSFMKLEQGLALISQGHAMNWRLSNENKKKRMAIFVSRADHCLMELLWRWKSEEILVDIPMVISNHPLLREAVEAYDIPFYHIPVSAETKEEAERRALEIMKNKVDFIVLARYMQILSPDFISRYPNRIINIHHSFLPAFIGANPYERAFERGVKLIGATAHYVTNDLDEGPIIQQDVLRVNHRYTTEELKVAGRHVERIVLAEAVSWHIEDKVLTHGNKTIVFT
ncbi:formyltetrahydrofolate deformylase [Aneurinibacillus migulanus]|uniref:Formyltetrahydrofolate deformylase n=1 Tax=Aneurinibacillus migulanus TaxID=47500 RepID=A0A0D1XX36_ANEMI|nr:formyltetrahydrofolate deformylase [Aneurinibacillus migulanus]KIV58781.1 formyltetrahydrofolate deformylase [Aneurinibacillus migulanus]KON96472.1 formyltetrahydrofolate deformylase [Aneurinibacillus migulanus]MED0892433.1 formyltetrahydrofolate deformylase [Aneurinibacillus migulanus]MED1615614.1 formyltetrahydrofolate deformylase [Aneurinibacillus migulanus]SDI19215.1 formyltetrahydrofolate deformylase [Aneurinibacillus migulanus]